MLPVCSSIVIFSPFRVASTKPPVAAMAGTASASDQASAKPRLQRVRSKRGIVVRLNNSKSPACVGSYCRME